jgi:WD40 repeat protein
MRSFFIISSPTTRRAAHFYQISPLCLLYYFNTTFDRTNCLTMSRFLFPQFPFTSGGNPGANGQIILRRDGDGEELRAETGTSIDCLQFSSDGRFLAAGGQDGMVTVWDCRDSREIIATLDLAPAWIDRLGWI